MWNIIGIIAGNYLPDLTNLGLDFAIAVTFIALVIPSVVNLPMLVTVTVAACLSVIFKLLNWELGLVLASVGAMYCGYLTSRKQSKFTLTKDRVNTQATEELL
jgi:predicted branched-subunit amino acid permease